MDIDKNAIDEGYTLDGYHIRLMHALKECKWHLAMPTAAQELPIWCDMTRLNTLDRVVILLKEIEQVSEAISKRDSL